MSSKLIFVGPDSCLRIPLLVNAGYKVEHANSLEEITTALENAFDAILLSDKASELFANLMSFSPYHPSAPVIVFQESTRDLPKMRIDLLVRNLEPPNEWLSRIAEVLSNSNRGKSN